MSIATTDLGTLLIILIMALVTLATRWGGVFIMAFVPISRRVQQFIRAMSGSVLIALLAPLAAQGDGGATHQHALGRDAGGDQRLAHRQRTVLRHFGIDRGTAGFVVEAGQQRAGLRRGGERGDDGGDLRGRGGRQCGLADVEMDLHQRFADFDHIDESDLARAERSDGLCGRLSAQLVGGQADDEGDDQRDDAEHHAHHDVEFAVFLIEHVLNSPEDARPDGSGGVGGILSE